MSLDERDCDLTDLSSIFGVMLCERGPDAVAVCIFNPSGLSDVPYDGARQVPVQIGNVRSVKPGEKPTTGAPMGF